MREIEARVLRPLNAGQLLTDDGPPYLNAYVNWGGSELYVEGYKQSVGDPATRTELG